MASKGEIVYPVDPHGESLAGLLPRGNVGGGERSLLPSLEVELALEGD